MDRELHNMNHIKAMQYLNENIGVCCDQNFESDIKVVDQEQSLEIVLPSVMITKLEC